MIVGKDYSRLIVTAITLSGFVIAGCTDNRGVEDLQKYVAELKNIEAPVIEPLPMMQPVEFFEYSAAAEGNPFSISNVLPEKKERPKSTPLALQLDRAREVLENYPIDSLKMVGTLNQGGALWAMVVAPDQTIHRVKKGNYMGTNLGEILQVAEGQIVVEETFESDEGIWEKRKVSVALPE